MSVVGNKYGRLTVVAEEPNGMLLCRCDCGNMHRINKMNLIYKSSRTKSCGCLRRELESANGKLVGSKNITKVTESNRKYGTNVYRIMKGRTCKTNKSGHTGVWYNPKRGKYEAYLTFRKHQYYFGGYDTLDEAVRARTAAEEKFFGPVLKEYDKEAKEIGTC